MNPLVHGSAGPWVGSLPTFGSTCACVAGTWRIDLSRARVHSAHMRTLVVTSVTSAASWSTPLSWSSRGVNSAATRPLCAPHSISSWIYQRYQHVVVSVPRLPLRCMKFKLLVRTYKYTVALWSVGTLPCYRCHLWLRPDLPAMGNSIFKYTPSHCFYCKLVL